MNLRANRYEGDGFIDDLPSSAAIEIGSAEFLNSVDNGLCPVDRIDRTQRVAVRDDDGVIDQPQQILVRH